MSGQTLGRMIASLRKERGMTQLELAERMGIEMPITQAIYSVMYEDACVYSVSEGMMGRAKTHEANANW